MSLRDKQQMYFKGKYVKLEIGLCRGKKEYDKRATLKDKQDRREMDRAIKRF